MKKTIVPLNLAVESIGNGKDSLTGKEGDGLTVTLNGKKRFLLWKSLKQLLSMELAEQHESNGEQPEPAEPVSSF